MNKSKGYLDFWEDDEYNLFVILIKKYGLDYDEISKQMNTKRKRLENKVYRLKKKFKEKG